MCAIHPDAYASPNSYSYCAAHLHTNSDVDLGTNINSTDSRRVQFNS
jgi:hypothetical protein